MIVPFQTCSGWNCKVKNCCLRYDSLGKNIIEGNEKPLKGNENCDLFINKDNV